MSSPSANSTPGTNNVPRRVIVAPTVGAFGPSAGRFFMVWACSFGINVTLIAGAALIFPLLGSAAASEEIVAPIEESTEMVDNQKEYNLTNTDVGEDDSVPLAYQNDRIEEVSVPGKVDPTATVGIDNAPSAPPMNIPPPSGAGGGTGGAAFDPNNSGFGSAMGSLGGMGGMGPAGGFGGRSGSTRYSGVQEGGGSGKSEAAVAWGLKFLALHQHSDGYWSLHEFHKHARTEPLPAGKVQPDNSQPMTNRNNNTAGTAFGLLPFLGAGLTNKPSKVKADYAWIKNDGDLKKFLESRPDYSKAVDKAIKYLMAKQSKSGNDRGFFGGDMYSHGIATIAMCEAFGLTSDPQIKASAQLGINYIVSSQDAAGGGWRYAPRQAGDTSVTGWQLMALKSGQMAGLTVPRPALKKVEAYLDSCESSNKGGYGYVPGSGETPVMTAVGALCRQYLGASPRSTSLLKSIDRIKKTPPGAAGIYYEYYATQVMHHMGGDAWTAWNSGPDGSGRGGIREYLITKQDQGQAGRTGQKGSFPGDDHVGGRLGSTSLSLLSLEVYYRHLPLYRRDVGEMKPENK